MIAFEVIDNPSFERCLYRLSATQPNDWTLP